MCALSPKVSSIRDRLINISIKRIHLIKKVLRSFMNKEAKGSSGEPVEEAKQEGQKNEGCCGCSSGECCSDEEEVKEKPDELAELKKQLSEEQEKYLRLLAEVDNVRKRSIKERSELLKYQGENIFKDIVSVVDDFERALKFADSEPEKLVEGIKLIFKGFQDILAKHEVRGESSIGKKFDPMIHAALSKVPVEGKEPDEVIDELKKPYFFKDKLLRVGEVVVSA